MDEGPVGMAAEVEVPGHSVDVKGALHPAPLLPVYVLNHPLQLLIIAHALVGVEGPVGDHYLLELILHVDLVDLEDILHVKGEEGAGVAGKLNVDVYSELLGKVLLVYDEVGVDFGRGEVDNGHDGEEKQHPNGDHRDAGPRHSPFAVLAGDSLVEVD